MLTTSEVINDLGYADSPSFLRPPEFHRFPAIARQLRLAASEHGLVGVYVLTDQPTSTTAVPMVYLCEATDRAKADKIHKLVWNQNIVPFLLVRTPVELRLYSGFAYSEVNGESDKNRLIRVLRESIGVIEFHHRIVRSFHAHSIDSGQIWEIEGKHVVPEERVDWRLLENLEKLGKVLRIRMGLPGHSAHALIGKYVYLRYLRDRGILSNERLHQFGVAPEEVFSRNAKVEALKILINGLDEWLNGQVFQIPWETRITSHHIRAVAGAFFGDDPETHQLNLFQDYDFAQIPVETLSVVYEQFLHAEDKARNKGAYYTPVAVIDFMLHAMEELQALHEGVRVLDPACGSGAFLVQAYRRLIEKTMVDTHRNKLPPSELRELLCKSFFGIDRDENACKVTELSLILTLLDYITPPDLTRSRGFRLPSLIGRNIFSGDEEDFFNTGSLFHQEIGGRKFDWIIGNPPWAELGKGNYSSVFAQKWKSENPQLPIGRNQVAELFAWKVALHCSRNEGAIGLLLPAMTLFKRESEKFRKAFFSQVQVESLVNFSNLAYVLFAGRAETPCVAVFYRSTPPREEHEIVTFSPFIANQEANRPRGKRRKLATWAIAVNSSEVKLIPPSEAATGESLTWKLSMWGSYRDRRLLEKVATAWPSLQVVAKTKNLVLSEGLQLRSGDANEAVEAIKLPPDAKVLLPKQFRNYSFAFTVPASALQQVPASKNFARRRGGAELPLAVCQPPHIWVSTSRKFAIYSDNFFVIPPRQIGIGGNAEEADFLKALALYVISDFAKYHQFFLSPQWGIRSSIADLDTLKLLPIMFSSDKQFVSKMARIYDKLSAFQITSRRENVLDLTAEISEGHISNTEPVSELIALANQHVYSTLKLEDDEETIVKDLIYNRLAANKGKASSEVTRRPSQGEIKQYVSTMRDELDAFLQNTSRRHMIRVTIDNISSIGILQITPVHNLDLMNPEIEDCTGDFGFLSKLRQILSEHRSQWLYFERNLRIYDEERIYLLKPLQKLHWLRSQALLDADSILADLLFGGNE